MSTSDLVEINADAIDANIFPYSEQELRESVEQFVDLAISGIDDTSGYQAVHKAQMELREKRVEIENRRKELKQGALEYGRKVDSVAKSLKGLIEPTENRLKEMKDRIEAEKEAIRQAALQKRLDALHAVEATDVRPQSVESMSDAAFQQLLTERTAQFEERKEQERIAAEQAAKREAEERERQRIEQERLQQERAEIEAEKKRLAEEQARLKAAEEERMRAEQERIAEERRKLEEEQRRQREEQQKIEAEKRRLEQEAEQRRIEQERQEREAAEQARIEAMKPDKEKLLAFASSLSKLQVPEVSDDTQPLADNIKVELHAFQVKLVAMIESFCAGKDVE